MNIARRTLNILGALFIVFAGAGLAMFIAQGSSKNTVPFSFVGGFALLPAIAHLIASFWVWHSDVAHVNPDRAVWGLGFSSVAFFTWVVIAAVLVEIALRDSAIVLDWPRVTLAIGMLFVLPLSAATNFLSFRRALVFARRHEA